MLTPQASKLEPYTKPKNKPFMSVCCRVLFMFMMMVMMFMLLFLLLPRNIFIHILSLVLQHLGRIF
jgi:hypothetical protein